MVSSFKNAYKGRAHRERSQLSARSRLGQLEKHKDYKLRAESFHKKAKTLNTLRRKAESKNEDEFYMKMIKGRQENGVHITKETGVIPEDTLKLLKTQDCNYLNWKRQTELKKVDRLKDELHFIEGRTKPQNSHTIFVEDEEEAKKFDAATHFNTDPRLVSRTHNRPRLDQLKQEVFSSQVSEKIEKQRLAKYAEVKQRIKRAEKLSDAKSELELHRNLMTKGRRKKVADRRGSKPPVYKWAQERKK